MSPARDGWLRLGTLTAPWGVRGEIKVRLDADPAYVRRVARVYLGAERRAVTLHGLYQRGRAYTLKLAGVNSIEEAQTLRDLEVAVPRAEAPPLPEGHFFVDDVVGLRAVTTAGRELGTVVDVLITGANDVYVVRGEAGEILIPAIGEVVVDIDPEAGLLRVEPMPGLLPDA